MTALLRDSGCCPICDRTVPRLLARSGDAVREMYVCPNHGPIGYGPQPLSVEGWVRACVARGAPATPLPL